MTTDIPRKAALARRRMLALTAAAALASVLPLQAFASDAGPARTRAPRPSRLSATRFYTFDPFTIPLLTDGVVREQFTLVIAVELKEEGQREEVAELEPKLRDAMYKELYRMVTFRRAGSPIPVIDAFKMRLYEIARRIAGDEIVSALLVQQAYKRPAR